MRAAVSYLAPAPKQLDIVEMADAAQMAAIRQPAPLVIVSSHSSTKPKKRDGSHSSTGSLKALDARRRKLGIAVQKLCAAAGIHTNTYRFAMEGHARSRGDTVKKLTDALNRLAAGTDAAKPETLCLSLLRLVTTTLAEKTGWDPDLMLSQDFSSENTNDPVWRQASRLRRCSIYLLVEGLGMGKAEIGHAIGMSRQGVHKAVADIEAARDDDAAFDAIMQKMMQRLKGDR